MASEHSSSGPTLHDMTPVTISSGLVPNPPPSTPFIPPSRSDWDLLFQPMFDESLNPPPYVDLQAPEVIAPIPKVVAPEHAVSTGSPSSTIVDQDAPSPSNSHTTPKTQTPIISHDVEEENHDIEVTIHGFVPYLRKLHEFECLEVWELVPPPDKAFVITLKWIYKVKLDELGGILKKKARLVDSWSSSRRGKRFFEELTFALLQRLEAISKFCLALHASFEHGRPIKGCVRLRFCNGSVTTEKHLMLDADHAVFQATRRSNHLAYTTLGDRLVSWSSKRQKSTAISKVLRRDSGKLAVTLTNSGGTSSNILCFLIFADSDVVGNPARGRSSCILDRVLSLLRFYTSRLLDAAYKKVLNLLKKGLLVLVFKSMIQGRTRGDLSKDITSSVEVLAGNPVKKILLKLNLSDHRKLKDGGEEYKKDATLKPFKSTNQERYEHVGLEVTSSQDGKDYKMAKRLCLVDDLKLLKITISNTSSRNKLNPEVNDHYNMLTRENQEYELKTTEEA
ncbi:hypothetical protein Tco_0216121 [Tanacetum coccineum]